MKGGVADAAIFALETERDGNGAAEAVRASRPELRQAGVLVVEIELPGAVEVHPGFALELGLRVFGAGNLRG